MTLFEVSSFTYHNRGGNLAGVQLLAKEDDLSESQMQQTAARLGYSETVFVRPLNHLQFALRYFTPLAEVPLCGHATIAAFSLLAQHGHLRAGQYQIQTLAGNLVILIHDNTVFMEQPLPVVYDEQPNNQEVANSLGIPVTDLAPDYPIRIVSTGLKDLMIPLRKPEILERIQPDFTKIKQLSDHYDSIGYHVFAIQPNNQLPTNCRNFAPSVGIDEEYATGTSNGALACYLFQALALTGDQTFDFRQGRPLDSQRGQILVKLEAHNRQIKRVLVGGNAVIQRSLPSA